jgi:hypothetical protein
MRKILINYLNIPLTLLVLNSCVKKNEVPKPTENGLLDVELGAIVGNRALVLNDSIYVNEVGNKFKVSMFKYYVSNIHLINQEGKKFLIPNSYCFFNQELGGGGHSHRLEHGNIAHLDSVPVGTFDSIQVMIGIDVLRNHAVGNTGVLDPSNGMYWNWNTGYIFVRFEGQYLKDTVVAGKDSILSKNLVYHIGFNSNARIVKLKLPNKLVIKSGSKSKLELEADLLELFKNPNLINFDEPGNRNSMAFSALQAKVADNYAKMLKVKDVVNP